MVGGGRDQCPLLHETKRMIADHCTTLMSAVHLHTMELGILFLLRWSARAGPTGAQEERRTHAGPGLEERWRPPRTPVPGNPGPPHPNPATLHVLVAAQFLRLDAVPAKTVSKKLDPESFRV